MQGVPSEHPPGAVCLITGDLTRYAIAMQALMQLKLPGPSVNAWFTGVLIAKSLNLAFQSVMDNPNLQWAWVMGDDHTFDPNILLQLLDRQVDVVAPFCLNRLPPMDPTIVEHNHQPSGRMKYLEDMPTSGLYKLKDDETCGDAGLLVRRSVLEKIGAPWYDHRMSGSIAAEDQAFIGRVKDAGIDVYIDAECPMGHIGLVEYKPVLKDGKWHVRLMGGGRFHIADLGPAPRKSEDWRIASEPGR